MPDLLNHSHCKVCDRAVSFGTDACEGDCAQSLAAMQKRRSRTVLLFYALGAFLLVLLAFQLLPGLLGG